MALSGMLNAAPLRTNESGMGGGTVAGVGFVSPKADPPPPLTTLPFLFPQHGGPQSADGLHAVGPPPSGGSSGSLICPLFFSQLHHHEPLFFAGPLISAEPSRPPCPADLSDRNSLRDTSRARLLCANLLAHSYTMPSHRCSSALALDRLKDAASFEARPSAIARPAPQSTLL